ncbi:MAG TPA: hypothetical protein VGP09_15620 [Caballeronia sp.]|jgi:hypothetical protein|nr:hypothetical protein [Caballeronia sp.]
MKIHDTGTTRQTLPFNALTGAPEAMFIASCETPLQHAHKIGAADAPALMHGSDA